MSLSSLEKLQNAPREQIVKQIDVNLEALNSTIAEFRKSHHALQAQLFIQELTAREQSRQTNIMVICTVIITVLTAVITYVTVFK